MASSDEEIEEDDQKNDNEDIDMDEEPIGESQIQEIEQKAISNPLSYDNHLQLISILRKAGELERLREARQRMHKYFPLAPNLWLDWIRDEQNLETISEEIERLFQMAVQDYTSVDVWIEYLQWAIGCGDVEKTREICERAVTAVGLNVAKGCLIWDAYREFETALLALYDPDMGGTISAQTKELYKKQKDLLYKLFRRQLSLPLMGLEDVYKEYLEYVTSESVDPTIESAYNNALKQLELLKPYEIELASTFPPLVESYEKYLDFEVTQKNPSRLQSLFERAVTDHCLNTGLWLRYTTWVDRELKIANVVLDVYRRAVANCPWSNQLWQNYLLALERNGAPFEKIESVFNQALDGGYSNVREAVDLWMTHCYQYRRKIPCDKADYSDLKKVFEKGANFLKEKFGDQDWDPDFIYRKNWARMEASLLKDTKAFRSLWDEIIGQGNGRFAAVWLEYLQLERQFGDVDHSRKLLFKAANTASDFPESIFYALIQFEKEEGSLEDLDKATVRIEQQRARINERKIKTQPKKESRSTKFHPQPDAEKSFESKDRKRNLDGGLKTKPQKVPTVKQQHSDISSSSKAISSTDKEGFTLPFAPPAAKKPKVETPSTSSATVPSISVHDTSKYDRTVFISNLDFKVGEDELREIFSKIGPVTEIRLVILKPGRSKGYGYVEFQNGSYIEEALKLDRHLIDGRPMYVSKCVDKNPGFNTATVHQPSAPAGFKYAEGLEKNKLFVKNVPREASEKDLEDIFRPFGNLLSIRLVVHKSGMSKGLAYIEYADEVTAAKALVKTDGTFLHGRRLSVAVSNPPPRRTGGEFGHPSVAGLGQQSAFSKSSLMTPRSLSSKPKLGVETVVKHADDKQKPVLLSEAKKSNEEFRKMFMKN